MDLMLYSNTYHWNCIYRYKSTPVAIKVILPDYSTALNSTWQERFVREVALHSRSRHENIVKVCVQLQESCKTKKQSRKS